MGVRGDRAHERHGLPLPDVARPYASGWGRRIRSRPDGLPRGLGGDPPRGRDRGVFVFPGRIRADGIPGRLRVAAAAGSREGGRRREFPRGTHGRGRLRQSGRGRPAPGVRPSRATRRTWTIPGVGHSAQPHPHARARTADGQEQMAGAYAGPLGGGCAGGARRSSGCRRGLARGGPGGPRPRRGRTGRGGGSGDMRAARWAKAHVPAWLREVEGETGRPVWRRLLLLGWSDLVAMIVAMIEVRLR